MAMLDDIVRWSDLHFGGSIPITPVSRAEYHAIKRHLGVQPWHELSFWDDVIGGRPLTRRWLSRPTITTAGGYKVDALGLDSDIKGRKREDAV